MIFVGLAPYHFFSATFWLYFVDFFVVHFYIYINILLLNILNSCPTQGRVEGWDAMKPLYYRSVSSKGAGRPRLMHHHKGGWNETKWMRWVWRNGGRGKREKPREKPTQTPFRPPRNPHGGSETRTRDSSGGRRASNRLRHEAAYFIILVIFCIFYLIHF